MFTLSPLKSLASLFPNDVETARTRRRFASLPVLAVSALLLAACGGGGGGGGGGGDGGGDNDPPPTGDTLEPTLASIQENIFTPICTQCHTGASAPQGLRLEAGMSYGMLVNVASAEVPELMRVEPGNPDDSYIIHKLEGTQAVGDRMPLGGPYLSTAQIGVIRQWITDGALEGDAGDPGDGGDMPDYKVAALTGAWPVPDSKLAAPPRDILLIADGELDTSLLHDGSVQILKLDERDPSTAEPVAMKNVRMEITSLAPTVIRLTAPADAWKPGRYEVRVHGDGAFAVADRAGKLIDGNADGEAGGDFSMRFDIEVPR